MSFLRLDGVHTFIEQFHVLEGVTIDVPEGSIVALVGRNGAGKTTTLYTIMGLYTARQGTVTFDGADITTSPPAKMAPEPESTEGAIS